MDGTVVCGGCGREIEISGLLEGEKYLCRGCLHQQVKTEPKERGRPSVWNLNVAIIGLILMIAAGVIPSVVYGFSTGHTYIGFIMAVAVVPVVGTPTLVSVLKGLRNIYLNQGLLYGLLGPWLLVWSFFPGLEGAVARTLMLSGAFLTVLGLTLCLHFFYAKKRYPRL